MADVAIGEPVIIFLDVDFTLTSRRSLIANGGFTPDDLDPLAVRLISVLCKRLLENGFDPQVVISSTWRTKHTNVEWWGLLFERLCRPRECFIYVAGLTPNIGNDMPRWQELREYIETRPYTNGKWPKWVAFDDRELGIDAWNKHWIQVDPDVGVTHVNINEAFHKLTGENLYPEELNQANKWIALRLWLGTLGIKRGKPKTKAA